MLERFTWFRQSAYLWRGDVNVYIDPWGLTETDPADVIFITHAHADHFSPEDIEKVQKPKTQIYAPHDVAVHRRLQRHGVISISPMSRATACLSVQSSSSTASWAEGRHALNDSSDSPAITTVSGSPCFSP